MLLGPSPQWVVALVAKQVVLRVSAYLLSCMRRILCAQNCLELISVVRCYSAHRDRTVELSVVTVNTHRQKSRVVRCYSEHRQNSRVVGCYSEHTHTEEPNCPLLQ